MKKLKVASLFWSMQVGVSGGAGKVHATIGTLIDHEIFDMIYLQLEDGKPRYEHAGEVIDLYEKFCLGFGVKKIISWFKLAWLIKNYCNSNQIDVILGQGDFFFMVTGLSKVLGNKTMCIGIVHTTLRIWPKFIQYLLGRCLRRNDKVVCISMQENEFLISSFGIKRNDLTLIHNSIDLEHIQNQAKQQLDQHDELLFNKDLFTYISVGRFTYQKNFRLLIDAFKLVLEKNRAIQLVIIGDGDQYEELLSYVVELKLEDNIKLLGKKNNPMQYMSHSHCFVMSSRFEGYPMVLLEACACGLPLVSLDCPTGPEEIIGNNEGGVLVKYNYDKDEKNTSNLAEGMLEIIDMNRVQISQRNKNFVKQFDNKVVGRKWNQYLLSLFS